MKITTININIIAITPNASPKEQSKPEQLIAFIIMNPMGNNRNIHPEQNASSHFFFNWPLNFKKPPILM